MTRTQWLAGLTLGLGMGFGVVGLAEAAPPKPKGPAKTTAPKTVTAAPAGDPVAGRAKADDQRCIECHGPQGQGAGHGNGPEGKFAKLAGQSPAYITKQIEDFRASRRKHDVMTIMARALEDDDLRDIAAYFASQTPMQGDGQGQSDAAQRLYTQGDAARGIPACSSCHGSATTPPVTPLHPTIVGQEYRYLSQQLLDWRTGTRRNSPGNVMNQVAAQLSEAEIDALALYLAGQRQESSSHVAADRVAPPAP